MNPFAQESGIAPEGHPIHTLMEEHRAFLERANRLIAAAQALKAKPEAAAASAELEQARAVVADLKAGQSHYLREENVIFPLLDKHGFSGPPTVMWAEHDQVRAVEKTLFQVMEAAATMAWFDFTAQLDRAAQQLAQLLTTHFYKENNILFPTAMELLSPQEWDEVQREFDRLGYTPFTPGREKAAPAAGAEPAGESAAGEITLPTGTLPREVLAALLNTLPVEITFVDHEDRLRYFSQPRDMIFTRSTAALGTKVQNCHPAKSLHLVNQILADFRAGARDVAEFHIHMQGKYVYIRYFAVRDPQGKYLGCMEVTQDIAPIQQIEGEKRLL
ncbi:MAG: DUF438 domain-containing protein [Candidatus Zixiibacteriota bacterium]|nr:MAG: DUF438 domain-containing protein [candidate division Zixibacteria bacterium]